MFSKPKPITPKNEKQKKKKKNTTTKNKDKNKTNKKTNHNLWDDINEISHHLYPRTIMVILILFDTAHVSF